MMKLCYFIETRQYFIIYLAYQYNEIKLKNNDKIHKIFYDDNYIKESV